MPPAKKSKVTRKRGRPRKRPRMESDEETTPPREPRSKRAKRPKRRCVADSDPKYTFSSDEEEDEVVPKRTTRVTREEVPERTTCSDSGEVPEKSPDSGEVPEKNPDSGEVPEKSPDSGEVPEKSPDSGEVPEKSPDSGEVPEKSPDSGEVPEKSPDSGEVPEKSPDSGEVPEKSPDSGEVPEKSPDSGEVPEKSPDSGEVPEKSPIENTAANDVSADSFSWDSDTSSQETTINVSAVIPAGFRLPGSTENALVAKFQQYGERYLTEQEMSEIATSVAATEEEREKIVEWLHCWIPKLMERVEARNETQVQQDVSKSSSGIMEDVGEGAPNGSERPGKEERKRANKNKKAEKKKPLSTCFGADREVELPEGLAMDLKTWSIDDVLKFVDHFLAPLDNYCVDEDKHAIRTERIDGMALHGMAVDDGLEYEEYGLSPRAYVSLKFRCRHIINRLNGF